METSEIVFCNGVGNNIKNNRQKSDILKFLFDKFELSIDKPIDYNYSDKLLSQLTKMDYLITTITQGNKYWLYLTTIKNEPVSIFIDKKINEGHRFPKMVIINYRFHQDLYTNTLFTGELIKDRNNNWSFIINDI